MQNILLVMAFYLVTAQPKVEKIPELKEQLKKNAFIHLKPFGEALSFSLKNARVKENGTVMWEEEDYCTPPLKEEKVAVLNEYFANIEVQPVKKGEGWEEIADLPHLFKI